MNTSTGTLLPEARYELRYTDLHHHGRGFACPCDAQGHVDIEDLPDRTLVNYLFARALVGKELSLPTVSPVAP
jgi:hypothetical protein